MFSKENKTREGHLKIFKEIDNQPILRMVHDWVNRTYIIQMTFRIIFSTKEEWERKSNSDGKRGLNPLQ